MAAMGERSCQFPHVCEAITEAQIAAVGVENQRTGTGRPYTICPRALDVGGFKYGNERAR